MTSGKGQGQHDRSMSSYISEDALWQNEHNGTSCESLPSSSQELLPKKCLWPRMTLNDPFLKGHWPQIEPGSSKKDLRRPDAERIGLIRCVKGIIKLFYHFHIVKGYVLDQTLGHQILRYRLEILYVSCLVYYLLHIFQVFEILENKMIRLGIKSLVFPKFWKCKIKILRFEITIEKNVRLLSVY